MVKTSQHNRYTLRIYGQHMSKYWWAFAITVVGIIASTSSDLALPFLYKRLFDGLSLSSRSNPHNLFITLGFIVLVKVVGGVFFRLSHFAQNFGVARVMSDLLDTCFSYLHGHSYGFFNNSFSGSLVRKATRYMRSFEDIYDQLVWSIIPSTLTLFAIIVILTHKDTMLGMGILVWAIVYIGMNYWFVQYKLKFDVNRVEADTAVSGHMADTLTNHINLKLFGGTGKEITYFSDLTNQLFQRQKLVWDLDSLSQALQSFFMYLLEFGALYMAIHLWQKGQFSLGDFVLLQTYVLQIGFNLWGVGRYLHTIYEELANAREMTEILLADHEIKDAPEAHDLVVSHGAIDFCNVRFEYASDQAIFDQFNLSIKPGERVALVGSSGSGKSTLIKLLFRFVDIHAGSICVDGQDIAQVTQNSLRDHLSLVPQDPSLFHRSILDNIRYAKPEATNEEVVAAAQAAHCHEFVSRFPAGYDTMVGERGVKLSGGERQRIAIARAILKNAPILVLDEATSNLDSHSEQLIQDALATLMKGKTTIVIAHRLSTIMQMDTIYVLKNGQIVEQGNHAQLIGKPKGLYQQLWSIQAGGFA